MGAAQGSGPRFHTQMWGFFSLSAERKANPQQLKNFPMSSLCFVTHTNPFLIKRQPEPYQGTEGQFPVLPLYLNFSLSSFLLPSNAGES